MDNNDKFMEILEKQHDRLKQVRTTLGIKQNEFAENITMTQGALSDIERGKVKISTSVIEKLVKAYGINPNYIILGVGPFFLKDLNTFHIKFNSQGSVQWQEV